MYEGQSSSEVFSVEYGLVESAFNFVVLDAAAGAVRFCFHSIWTKCRCSAIEQIKQIERTDIFLSKNINYIVLIPNTTHSIIAHIETQYLLSIFVLKKK